MSLIGAVLIARQVLTVVSRIVDVLHDEKADRTQLQPLVSALPELQQQLAAAVPEAPPAAPEGATPPTPRT